MARVEFALPDVGEGLVDQVVEGTPQPQGYEVCNSTFHKIAAKA